MNMVGSTTIEQNNCIIVVRYKAEEIVYLEWCGGSIEH